MNSETKPQNIIERPRYWRLAVETGGDMLRALARSTVDDSALLNFALPLDPLAANPTAALEEAVYSVPALLSDFGRVDVVVRTGAFTVVPDVLDEGGRMAAAECAGIVGDSDTLHADTLPDCEAAVMWSLPSDTANFLARTFRNPRLHSHIGVLARYFGRKSAMGNCGKTFVHFNGMESIDIVAFGADGRLLTLVTRQAATDNDALYFILATLGANRFAVETDELLLCGDRRRRESLSPTLRRYVRSVLPVIFPSAAYRAGGDAMDAPFPLVILPLCE